jgi:hypothetical protein
MKELVGAQQRKEELATDGLRILTGCCSEGGHNMALDNYLPFHLCRRLH